MWADTNSMRESSALLYGQYFHNFWFYSQFIWHLTNEGTQNGHYSDKNHANAGIILAVTLVLLQLGYSAARWPFNTIRFLDKGKITPLCEYVMYLLEIHNMVFSSLRPVKEFKFHLRRTIITGVTSFGLVIYRLAGPNYCFQSKSANEL